MDPYQPLKPSQIERAYFILSNRDKILKITMAVGIAAVLAIYGWLIFNLAALISAGSYESMAASIMPQSDWENYHRARAPEDLSIQSPIFLSIGESRYNLVATIENLNSDWSAYRVAYHFVVNGQELESQSAFVNPLEQRFLIQTAYQTVLPINNLQVVIDDIVWQRYENQVQPINWDITQTAYTPVGNVDTPSGPTTVPANASWMARNLSLYNFWEVEFQVAIYSGDRMVGVNSIRAKDFNSLENRALSAVWLHNLPRVNNVKIFPLVNWLDENNYKTLDIEVNSVR